MIIYKNKQILIKSIIKVDEKILYFQIDSDAETSDFIEECESVSEMPIDTSSNVSKKQLPAIKRSNRGKQLKL